VVVPDHVVVFTIPLPIIPVLSTPLLDQNELLIKLWPFKEQARGYRLDKKTKMVMVTEK
jgi:hypothetical protein